MIRASNACLVAGLLAVLMVITVVCNATDPEQPAAPVDDTWVLELLDGRTLIEGSAITLRIDGNHLDGFDGCNRYGWRTDMGEPIAGEDGIFEVSGFDRTNRDCLKPEGVMDQADLYVSALVEAERYRVEGDRMEIIDGEGAVRLVFKRDTLPKGARNWESRSSPATARAGRA